MVKKLGVFGPRTEVVDAMHASEQDSPKSRHDSLRTGAEFVDRVH